MADLAKPRGHLALRGSGPASPDGKPVQNNRLRAKRLDVRNAAAQRAALMRDERGNPLARQIVLGQERPHRPGYSAHQLGDPTKTTSYASMCPILFFKGGL